MHRTTSIAVYNNVAPADDNDIVLFKRERGWVCSKRGARRVLNRSLLCVGEGTQSRGRCALIFFFFTHLNVSRPRVFARTSVTRANVVCRQSSETRTRVGVREHTSVLVLRTSLSADQIYDYVCRAPGRETLRHVFSPGDDDVTACTFRVRNSTRTFISAFEAPPLGGSRRSKTTARNLSNDTCCRSLSATSSFRFDARAYRRRFSLCADRSPFCSSRVKPIM